MKELNYNKRDLNQYFRVNSATKHKPVDTPQYKIKDLKGKLNRLQQQASIHKQNLLLLRKMHDIDSKKPASTPTFHLNSLNIKTRMDAFKKIQNQNNDIIKRLRSQKSRYSTQIYEQDFKRTTSVSKSLRKSHYRHNTETSLFKSSKTYTSQFEMLPQPADGFSDRLIVYTEILAVKNRSCHLEISCNSKFYYVLLQEFSSQRFFKLRLIRATGQHLIQLIKQSQINFVDRIKKKGNNYIMIVPFFPFARSYLFSELKKAANIDQMIKQEWQKQQVKDSLKNKQNQHQGEKDLFLKQFQQSVNANSSPSQQYNIERLDAEPSQSVTQKSFHTYKDEPADQ